MYSFRHFNLYNLIAGYLYVQSVDQGFCPVGFQIEQVTNMYVGVRICYLFSCTADD